MRIILLVVFTMTMFLWLLGLLGAVSSIASMIAWLAFFACLFLGIAVFVEGAKGP